MTVTGLFGVSAALHPDPQTSAAGRDHEARDVQNLT